MAETTFKVMVRKTVQVKQYEPTTIEFSVESTCPRENVIAEFGRAFAEIKGELNRVFGSKKHDDMEVLG